MKKNIKISGIIHSVIDPSTFVIFVRERKYGGKFGRSRSVSKKYLAHCNDKNFELKKDLLVTIAESRPFSKKKSWVLVF